jgi:hypothetical protein
MRSICKLAAPIVAAIPCSGLAHSQQLGVSIAPTQLPGQSNGSEYFATGIGLFGDTAMGDVNGDGHDDMIFAYYDLTQGAPAVRTTAVLNGLTGGYLSAHNHPDAILNASGLWGSAICVLGDLDGDGSDEYAIGDRNSNHVYVYWGEPPASVFPDNLMCVLHQPPGPVSGAGSNPHFGWSLSKAGDINADSVLDLLVGDATVQTDDTNELVQIGAVYIFSGYEMMAAWKVANDANDTNLRHLRSSVNIGKITRIRSTTGVQYLGEQVAGGVDATGDGRVDILITARHVDFVLNGGPDYHAGVLLYSGLVFNQPVHTFSEPPAYGQHPSAWQNFGISIDFVGDIEGPGTAPNGLEMGNDDVLIGYPGHWGNSTNPQPGYAFVLSSAGGQVIEVQEGSVNGATGSAMGMHVASAGDVDGDGAGDYFVAEPLYRSPGDSPGIGHGRGNVFVVKGGSGLNLGPNQATRFDEQYGSTDVGRHGQDMASSGLPRVYIPGQSFMTVGFLCFTNWDSSSPGPVALTSTEYH